MSTCGSVLDLCTAVHTPVPRGPAVGCRRVGRTGPLGRQGSPGTPEAPVPVGDGGLREVCGRLAGQRQRIDMTRPATMAPKPMAKFHADSETMNGIRSPAT